MVNLFGLSFVVGFALCALFVGLFYLDARLRRLEAERHLPYWLRNGLDDLSAIDTDMLCWIRDALLVIEGRQEDRRHLMAQIRNGSYDEEQPAAPRRTAVPHTATSGATASRAKRTPVPR